VSGSVVLLAKRKFNTRSLFANNEAGLALDVDVFCGVSQVQLVVDLNEAAERSITLITRPVN
jgi:hypothetical protein